MKLTAQLIIMALFILGFLVTLYRDVNGKEALKPAGFKGVVSTLVIYALLSLVQWKAGLFSELLPKL